MDRAARLKGMPTSSSRPTAPRLSVPLADALDGSTALGGLLQRVQASEQRLADARTALPPGLAAHLKAGPLDDNSWTLLASSGGAAAKLRQCLPAVQQRLRDRGWPDLPVRVKVHVGRGA